MQVFYTLGFGILMLALGFSLAWLYTHRARKMQAWNRRVASHGGHLFSGHRGDTLLFIQASPQCYGISGYRESDLLGKSLLDVSHPFDQEGLQRYAQSVWLGQSREPISWRMMRADLGWAWVQSRAYKIEEPPGQPWLLLETYSISERLQTEKALREAERRYRMICEQIVDVVWVYNVEKMRYTYVSPSLETVLGWSTSQTVEQSDAPWFSKDRAFAFKQQVNERLDCYTISGNENNPSVREFQAQKADGSLIWMECKSVLKRSAAGCLEITGVLRDITHSKKMAESLRQRERELQENNRIFMALLDVVPTRVFWKNIQGCYLGCNRAFLEDLGLTKSSELLGKTDRELNWRLYSQDGVDYESRVLESAEGVAGTVSEWSGSDGNIHYALVHRSPLKDPEGQVTGVLGTYSDITHLVVAEKSLRESEKRYRLMVDHQNDLMVKMDVDTKLLYASPSFCRMQGAPLDVLLGTSLLQRLEKADQERLRDALERVQAPPYCASFEQKSESYGQSQWISWSLQGIPDEASGNVRVLVGAGRDITGQKEILDERERLLYQLEQKNVELERLAHLVTHDVKSALFNVSGFAQELKRDLGEGCISAVSEDAEYIIQAGDRICSLVEAELYLTELGRDFRSEWFELGALVSAVLRERSAEFLGHGMEVTVQSSAHPVYGDREKLATALRHLVDNALKFRAPRQAALLVSIERQVQSKGMEIVIGFHDNGMGCDLELSPRLFHVYFREESSKPSVAKGLACVQRIAQLHGGRVWAESKGHQQGLSVYMALPAPERFT